MKETIPLDILFESDIYTNLYSGNTTDKIIESAKALLKHPSNKIFHMKKLKYILENINRIAKEFKDKHMKGGALSSDDLRSMLSGSYEKNLSNAGKFTVDKDLSGKRVKVYHNPETNQTVVSHRGTANMKDWLTDAGMTFGYEGGKRFKHSKKVQKKAEKKYGTENLTTVGHSLGARLAEKYGQKGNEVITLNKPIIPKTFGKKISEKQYDIRTENDPVSALHSLQKNEKMKTIKSDTYNPLTEHGVDVLKRSNDIYGKGLLEETHRKIKELEPIVKATGKHKRKLANLFKIKYGLMKRMKGGMSFRGADGKLNTEYVKYDKEFINKSGRKGRFDPNILQTINMDELPELVKLDPSVNEEKGEDQKIYYTQIADIFKVHNDDLEGKNGEDENGEFKKEKIRDLNILKDEIKNTTIKNFIEEKIEDIENDIELTPITNKYINSLDEGDVKDFCLKYNSTLKGNTSVDFTSHSEASKKESDRILPEREKQQLYIKYGTTKDNILEKKIEEEVKNKRNTMNTMYRKGDYENNRRRADDYNDAKKELEKFISAKPNIIRGNISEDFLSENPTILTAIDNDNSSFFNTKEIHGFSKPFANLLNEQLPTYKDAILRTIPIDGIKKNTLWELKSFTSPENNEYNTTKFIGTENQFFGNKKIRYQFLYNVEGSRKPKSFLQLDPNDKIISLNNIDVIINDANPNPNPNPEEIIKLLPKRNAGYQYYFFENNPNNYRFTNPLNYIMDINRDYNNKLLEGETPTNYVFGKKYFRTLPNTYEMQNRPYTAEEEAEEEKSRIERTDVERFLYKRKK